MNDMVISKTPKLRLLRARRTAVVLKIAELEAKLAVLKKMHSDYEIAERVLLRLGLENGEDVEDFPALRGYVEARYDVYWPDMGWPVWHGAIAEKGAPE